METTCPPPRVDIPTDARLTSEYYKTKNIPPRFNSPYWFKGYGCQKRPPNHPFYRTTSIDYGWYPPTIHTVPAEFFPMSQKFSTLQASGGMYKNFSLNTALDISPI